MKLALAQIDMRLGDIEGICGRIEDQARLAPTPLEYELYFHI